MCLQVVGSSIARNLLVAAIRSREMTLVWLQNRASTWFNHQPATASGAKPIAVVPPARLTLAGYPAGRYQIQWWDTWKGEPAGTEQVVAKDGKIVLLTGAIKTDRAAKVTPIR